jgi:hypothetical protein
VIRIHIGPFLVHFFSLAPIWNLVKWYVEGKQQAVALDVGKIAPLEAAREREEAGRNATAPKHGTYPCTHALGGAAEA